MRSNSGLQDAINRIEKLLKINTIEKYIYKIFAGLYILLSFILYYFVVALNKTSESMQFIGFAIFVWFITFAIILFLH